MRIHATVFAIAFVPWLAFASEDLTFHGEYTKGCFGCSAEATLKVTLSDSIITATLEAPSEPCVMTFGEGRLSRVIQHDGFFGFEDESIYSLPLLGNCGRDNVFGPTRDLSIGKDRSGQIVKVQVSASRSGGSSPRWVYFSKLESSLN